MVITPAKEAWHIGRADVLVDVVFLAQPLRGTVVNRDFGEALRRPRAYRSSVRRGVAAQRRPTGGYAPTNECANAIERSGPSESKPAEPARRCANGSARLRRRAPRRVLDALEQVRQFPAVVKEPASAIRTDSTPTAATSPARGRLGRPVARMSIGPAAQRPCSPGVRCRRVRARYQTPARAAGQPPRAARSMYRPSTRLTLD